MKRRRLGGEGETGKGAVRNSEEGVEQLCRGERGYLAWNEVKCGGESARERNLGDREVPG